MGDLNKFCERMRYWCDEGNLGYDQSNRQDIRYGGECDCSSLVIYALKEAGFDTGAASYTGNLSGNLVALSLIHICHCWKVSFLSSNRYVTCCQRSLPCFSQLHWLRF